MSGAAGSGEFVAEEVRGEADAFGHDEVGGPGVGELGDGESGGDGVGCGEHHLPSGVGEGVEDLRPFVAADFAKALFDK